MLKGPGTRSHLEGGTCMEGVRKLTEVASWKGQQEMCCPPSAQNPENQSKFCLPHHPTVCLFLTTDWNQVKHQVCLRAWFDVPVQWGSVPVPAASLSTAFFVETLLQFTVLGGKTTTHKPWLTQLLRKWWVLINFVFWVMESKRDLEVQLIWRMTL